MDPKIDRTLNLRNNTDRVYFYEQLEKSKDLPFTFEEIKESIEFISTRLEDDEWLIIYPRLVNLGQTSISHGNLVTEIQIASFEDGQPLYHLCNFLEDIIPLGLNLLLLRSLANFDRYIQRLNIPSHERTSTIFEIFVTANCRCSGYDVLPEPSNGKDGFCDLKIWKGKNELYIECKSLNSIDSDLYQKRQSFIDALCEHVFEEASSYLRDRQRIVIQLPSNYRRKAKTDSWNYQIISSLNNDKFDEWLEIDGIKYCIYTGQFDSILPARHLAACCGMRSGWFDVQIISAMGNASSRLNKIIKEAKKQLPDNRKGVIMIQTQYSDILPNIAKDKLATEYYKNIVCIIGVDASHYTTIMKNDIYSDLDCDFTKASTSNRR